MSIGSPANKGFQFHKVRPAYVATRGSSRCPHTVLNGIDTGGGTICTRRLVSVHSGETWGRCPYISRSITTPDISMRNEGQHRIGSSPFCFGEKCICGKYRQAINQSTQSFAKNQPLQIPNNCLPRIVIRVGKDCKRYLGWEEAVLWGDVVVTESW